MDSTPGMMLPQAMRRSSTRVRTAFLADATSGKLLKRMTTSLLTGAAPVKMRSGGGKRNFGRRDGTLPRDPSAAEHFVATIADGSLAGRDCALRHAESDARGPVALRRNDRS